MISPPAPLADPAPSASFFDVYDNRAVPGADLKLGLALSARRQVS